MRKALTVLIWSVVLTLGAVTAVANFWYGMLVADGHERYVYAVGGTVLDITKTFLPTVLATFLVGRLTPGTFFKHLAGWTIWSLAVAWSITCALGLYAITKEAKVGNVQGQQATYNQLTADKPKKEARVSELEAVKARETIEGEIAAQKRDRLWDRTSGCTDATAGPSRTYCAGIETLTASLATAPTAAAHAVDLETARGELREIETKLSGMNLNEVLKKADPAGEALAKLIGWDIDTLKSRLALLIAVLFECGGLLPWIAFGSHAPVPTPVAATSKRRKEPELAQPMPVESPAPVTEVTPLALPEIDSAVSRWAKASLIRRKGSFTPPADMRADFETWCRLHGEEPMNDTAFGKEMTRLGFERKKRGGNMRYLDIAILPKSRDLKLVSATA
jgi:hypothetical protein